MLGVPIGSPKGVPMSAPELRSTSSPSLQPLFSPTQPAEIAARLRAAGCVFAEDEARLLLGAFSNFGDLARAVGRRLAGYPLEHILGWAEFCGIRIAVDPGVFVPRRRTELLVQEAAELLEGPAVDARVASSSAPPAVVVDLCCGSGAVGAALARRVGAGRIELHAADIDSAAVKCAGRNLAEAGGQVHQGDLYQALPPALKGSVKILAVNAPYVPTGAIATMPPEAREHEPLISLDGGADGLDVHGRVASGALDWLCAGGHLLIETSKRQAVRTAGFMAREGLVSRIVHSDELDGTVVIGTVAT